MSSVGGSSGTVQVPAAALQQIMAALEKHDTQQEKIETQLGQLVAGQLLERKKRQEAEAAERSNSKKKRQEPSSFKLSNKRLKQSSKQPPLRTTVTITAAIDEKVSDLLRQQAKLVGERSRRSSSSTSSARGPRSRCPRRTAC